MIGYYELTEKARLYKGELLKGWPLEVALKGHVHSPLLANSIAELLGDTDKPVYDFGCGKGDYLAHLAAKGIGAMKTGFEYTPETFRPHTNFGNIYFGVDITKDLPIKPELHGRGHVICLEVIEHLEKHEHADAMNNIADFCDVGCWFVCSVAKPLQHGDGHHSCLSELEVMQLIRPYGFEWNPELTINFRHFIEVSCDWFQNTLYVFKRTADIKPAIESNLETIEI